MTKTASVHDIAGTYKPERHKEKLENENANNELLTDSKPVKPQGLDERASEIWDSKVRLLPWLTEAESEALALFCILYSDFEKNPAEFPASRLNVFIKLNSELGMNPISRGKFKYEPPKTAKNKFFND